MSNEYGLKCPICGNTNDFNITTHHTVSIHGDDVDNDDSCSWENDDEITCQQCSSYGPVKSFIEE